MFKKIQLAILISGISATSYAYVVESNLTVENKTNVPMVMIIEQPNGQPVKTISIPAHQTIDKQYMQNGDHSGLLYQTSSAPFKIRETDENGKVLAQGRVVYYVGASLVNKYSYLNAVTAANNLTVDPVYTCKNGGYETTFENKLVIAGTADKELKIKKFPTDFSCQGFKSSTWNDATRQYTAVCFDGSSSTFTKVPRDYYQGVGYSDGVNKYFVNLEQAGAMPMQGIFDNNIGQEYCETWLGEIL